MLEDFLATVMRGFTLFQAETAQLPPAVLAWMWAMRIVFGGSVIFLPRVGALVTFGTMLATAVLRFYAKGLYPDVPASHIGALVHVVLWLPLAAFLLYSMRGQREPRGSHFDRVFAIWRPVVIGMLAVSLVFDVREVMRMLA